MGRLGTARIHRLPARVVGRTSDLRARTGTLGAAGSVARMGAGEPRRRSLLRRSRRSSTASRPVCPTISATRSDARAEGIPLYVVETIRMLLDRGLLVQEGARYVVTGDVTALEVPETLQALVASRLDGLDPAERSLLQDASVLGQSFTAAAAAALSGRPEAEVAAVLDRLVGQAGPVPATTITGSPERGQYVFLQALLRTVAYGTLSRRARKARHLAAAGHLRDTWPGEARDIAEVLASHYLEAIRADPEAEDVAESARIGLRDAHRRRARGRFARPRARGPALLRARRRACRHRSATSRAARAGRPRVARQRRSAGRRGAVETGDRVPRAQRDIAGRDGDDHARDHASPRGPSRRSAGVARPVPPQ